MGLFDESFSSVEVARILGVHRVTVASWIKQGALAAARTPGGRYLVSRRALRQFLLERSLPIPAFLALDDKKTVVAVDDEKAILNVLHDYFTETDLHKLYRLQTFTNPLEAALFIGDAKPALVFLDLFMPQLDGFALAAKIKETSPITKVIVLTGHATLANMKKLGRMEVDGVLRKPFELEAIRTILAEQL